MFKTFFAFLYVLELIGSKCFGLTITIHFDAIETQFANKIQTLNSFV